MKQSILTTLLGLTIAMVTPSLAVADNNDKKWRSNNSQARSHIERKRHAVKQSKQRNFAKRHHNNANKHNSNKRYANKHKHNRRHHNANTSFSITFGNGRPELIYGNSYPDRPVYNSNRRHNKKRIYQRMDSQSRRIQKGINRGQLVRSEIRTLRKEQNRISRKVSRFNRDGRLNRHERSKINRLLDIADNNIRRMKHNRLTRYSHRYNDRFVRR